jgi:hypothetical protein
MIKKTTIKRRAGGQIGSDKNANDDMEFADSSSATVTVTFVKMDTNRVK